MLKSSNYSDAYILVNGTITVAPQAGNNPNNDDKKVVFKNWAPVTGYISEIKNTQIDNAESYLIIILLISLKEGECFNLNHNQSSRHLGCLRYFI